MSTFFKTSNIGKTKELYNKTLIYKNEMIEANYMNLIDFNIAEKYLYGRVDREYVAMEVNTDHATMTGIADDDPDVRVLSFVARAYNDLLTKFNTKRMRGEISGDESYLSSLRAKKAYQNPLVLYNSHYESIKTAVSAAFNDNNIKVYDFRSFMREFMIIIKDIIKENPFTYTAFIKSKLCPMNISGLVIELSTEKKSNDALKIADFKRSKNWEFYLNACRSYGFLVDKRNPGRLVADIGSTEMIKYCANEPSFGQTSTEFLLQTVYKPVHIDYYPKLPLLLLDLYNSVRREHTEAIFCENTGELKTKIVTPQPYTLGTLLENFPDIYFLNAYIALRFLEEEAKFTEERKTEIRRQLNSIYATDGYMTAVSYFERVISLPYDHSGSLTDIINRVKIRNQ